MLSLDYILKQTSDLPVFSPTVQEVIRAADRSTSSAHDVAKALRGDQGLAIKILRLANSSWYGLSRSTDCLEQAVVMLGMKGIRSLAIAASSYSWLSRELPGWGIGPEQLWTHSASVALAAQQLARRSKLADPDLALTSGLLHDIGMVALSMSLQTKTMAIKAYAQREKMTFPQVEQKVLGFDHCQVGAGLAEAWGMPERIVEAIRWHHEPGKASEYFGLAAVIHGAVHLADDLGYGLSRSGFEFSPCPVALKAVGLTVRVKKELADNLKQDMEEYQRLFKERTAA